MTHQFSGHSPAELFPKSWIIPLPPSAPEQNHRLVVNMVLNALDGWLNSLPDAKKDAEGNVRLRHILVLEEAHKTLKSKLPALSKLIRWSRSKGDVVILTSQNPDEFSRQDEDCLSNIGLTASFATTANPSHAKKAFGRCADDLPTLERGMALCKVGSEEARKVRVWGR